MSIASNVTSPSPSSSEALQPQPIDPADFNPFDHVGKKENVAPGQAKKIRFGEVELDIGADAVDQSTDLTIKNICEDLSPLDQGMVNVTKGQGNCKDFRFHPKGQKFKNKIKIKILYDKNLLPIGYFGHIITRSLL